MAAVTIYTDGSCWPSGTGAGGAAAILVAGDREMEVTRSVLAPTTNNRMELAAVLIGFAALQGGPHDVLVVSDSAYVVNGWNVHLERWRARGWMTADRKPVANREWWEALDAYRYLHRIRMEHVKGHAGHSYNERCDVLAGEARARAERRAVCMSDGVVYTPT